MSSTWEVEEEAGERLGVPLQHGDQRPRLDMWPDSPFIEDGETDAGHGQADVEIRIGGQDPRIHAHGEVPTVLGELPPIRRLPGSRDPVDADVLDQVARMLGNGVTFEVRRGPDDGHSQLAGDRKGDDRAVLDLELALIREDRGGSYEAARNAAELAPGTLPQVQWAWEALSLGHPEEAIGILSSMDPTRGEVRRSRAYWGFLTEAQHMVGDHRRELRQARRARELDPLSPHPYEFEVRALAALGRVRDAESVLDEALSRPFRDAAINPGRLLLIVAEELNAHQQAEASIRLFRRAADWYAALPAEDPVRYSGDRVVALLGAGDLGAAEGVLDTLRARRPESLWGGGLAGVSAAMRGDRDAAEAAMSLLDSVDAPYIQYQRFLAQAGILAHLGREDEAIDHLRRAFRAGLRYGVSPHSNVLLDPLRDVPAFEELMRPRGD